MESGTMLERLKLLEKNVRQLLEFKGKVRLEDMLEDISREWALRYGLLESIQIIIDISCHIVAKYNLGNPSTYTECIDLLEKYGYLDKSVASKINAMVGLRNILVHEYVNIDSKRLYNLLDKIGDIAEFISKVKDFC